MFPASSIPSLTRLSSTLHMTSTRLSHHGLRRLGKGRSLDFNTSGWRIIVAIALWVVVGFIRGWWAVPLLWPSIFVQCTQSYDLAPGLKIVRTDGDDSYIVEMTRLETRDLNRSLLLP